MHPITAPLPAISPRGSVRAGGEAAHTVVWLRGEHDIATSAELSDALAWASGRDDADVVVDLSGVVFMDASTLGAIVAARLALRAQSRALTLRAPSARAERVLRLCGLADPPGRT